MSRKSYKQGVNHRSNLLGTLILLIIWAVLFSMLSERFAEWMDKHVWKEELSEGDLDGEERKWEDIPVTDEPPTAVVPPQREGESV